jgi:hypothetical protein
LKQVKQVNLIFGCSPIVDNTQSVSLSGATQSAADFAYAGTAFDESARIGTIRQRLLECRVVGIVRRRSQKAREHGRLNEKHEEPSD